MKDTKTKPAAWSIAILAILAGFTASANLAAPPELEMSTILVEENVDIRITGNHHANVTGTFEFADTLAEEHYLRFYLPVYARPTTALEEFRPKIHLGDKQLEVVHVENQPVCLKDIAKFGDLPRLEGLELHWFVIGHNMPKQSEKGGEDRRISLKIRYQQELVDNRFIYTPLIPKQQESRDYGNITVTSDHPFHIQEKDKHDIVEKESSLVVEPHHKRAIVIEVAFVTTKPN